MLDVLAQIQRNNNIVGYKLTDRKEEITVDTEQFIKLVKGGVVYKVRYFEDTEEVRGICKFNLQDLKTEHQSNPTDTKSKPHRTLKIKHRIIRYRQDYILEMLRYKYLDYIQVKYYTNEILKPTNKELRKSITTLEKLTNKFIDKTITDIQPFIDNYRERHEIIGYCIENTSGKTLVIKDKRRKRYMKLRPGKQANISLSDYAVLSKRYNITDELTKSEELLLSIPDITDDILVEQLPENIRQKIISTSQYNYYKDNIAKSILREDDYNSYKQTGKVW